jgi:hypothetical protein
VGPLKRGDLIQKLSQNGAVLLRHGSKHDIYINYNTGKQDAVPRHNEIVNPTAWSIIKNLS